MFYEVFRKGEWIMSDWYLKGGAGLADPDPVGDWYLKGGKYIARRSISDHQTSINEDNEDNERKED